MEGKGEPERVTEELIDWNIREGGQQTYDRSHGGYREADAVGPDQPTCAAQKQLGSAGG